MILNLISQAIRAALSGDDAATAASIVGKVVSAYDFDDAPGYLFDSQRNNTLTNGSTTQGTDGVSSKDATFAANTFLTQDSNDFDFRTGDFCIGGWFYFPAGGSGPDLNAGLLSKYRVASSAGRQYSLLRENGVIKFAVSTDGASISAVAQEPAAIPGAGYYFILAWRDTAAGKIFLQVNNGTIREATFSGASSLFNGPAALTFGRLEDNGTVYNGNNGYRMDCVILANQMLTPAERTWLYNGGVGRSFTSVKTLAGTAIDPFFDNVVSLLHFDGTNGSTTFTDVTGRPWTAENTADIRTDTAKFGGASGWFQNVPGGGTSDTGSRITAPDSADLRFGTGDFTVEGWFIPQTPLLGFGAFYRKGQNTAGGLTLAVTPTQLTLRADSVTDTNVAVSLSTSEWSHIAFTREAGLVRFFVNGSLVGSATRTFNHTDTEALFIGSVAGDTRFAYNGRIDDLRITKGVARYTTNFAPPVAAFPDAGPAASSEILPAAFSQSSLYSGLAAATTANMGDANDDVAPTTGTATNSTALDWIMADLGAAATVSRVALGGGTMPGWGGIAFYLNGGAIQSSPDNSTWTDAAFISGVVDSGANRDTDILITDPVSARYWRIARPAYVAAATFRLFDDGVSKATGVTYTQSSVYGGLAGNEANLNETPRNITTGAATNNEPSAFIRADLGSSRAVSYVVVGGGDIPGWGTVATYAHGQPIQSSDDGTTWTTRATVPIALGNSGAAAELAIPVNATARYWRITRSGFLSLTSFRFYCSD